MWLQLERCGLALVSRWQRLYMLGCVDRLLLGSLHLRVGVEHIRERLLASFGFDNGCAAIHDDWLIDGSCLFHGASFAKKCLFIALSDAIFWLFKRRARLLDRAQLLLVWKVARLDLDQVQVATDFRSGRVA